MLVSDSIVMHCNDQMFSLQRDVNTVLFLYEMFYQNLLQSLNL